MLIIRITARIAVMTGAAMIDREHSHALDVFVAAERLLRPDSDDAQALNALFRFLIAPADALSEVAQAATSGPRPFGQRVLAHAEAIAPSPDSSVVVRSLMLFAQAVWLFGSEETAWNWWLRPLEIEHAGLRKAPCDMAGDAKQAHQLFTMMVRTTEGIY
ncbi:uncharacterized protein (DUF2384 family) [Luteibacter sp. HA06]